MSELAGLVARLPYVTRLDETQACDGYRWSSMSRKALADSFLMSRYKCKARARWQFRALRLSVRSPYPAADGVYCWHHLFSCGLQHDDAEDRRYRRALARLKAADEWNAQLAGAAARLARL